MRSLRAHSLAEARLYLKVTPCQDCSQGPWEVQDELPPPPDAPEAGRDRTLRARCRHCDAQRDFVFHCAAPPPDGTARPAGPVNPTPDASEIIDLGQWLSLYYLLLESANRADDNTESRGLTLQAAECLDEALKFYGADDELPGRSAFFVESSRQAFAEHPESFARQRLRDMRGKLPVGRALTPHLAREAEDRKEKRWWQFWRT